MKRSEEVNEWLRFAEMDLTAANHLWQTLHPQPLEVICYHCQQAAEKSLKAIFVAHEHEVVKTHDLTLLYATLVKLDAEILPLKEPCKKLNIYSSQARYPNELEINQTHAQLALKDARTIYETINSLFE
ncbi:MAG: HEPN domain-containing protein [Thermoguttaceae bacterium]